MTTPVGAELDYRAVTTAATTLAGNAVTPTANRLLLAAVNLFTATATVDDVLASQVSGWGRTWVKLATTEAADGGLRRMVLFGAIQGAGPVSGTFQIAGLTKAHSAQIEVAQWANTPLTSVAAAVRNPTIGRAVNAAGLSITLPTPASPTNATAGWFGSKGTPTTLVVDPTGSPSWSALRNSSIDTSRKMLVEQRAAATDLAVSMSATPATSPFTGYHHWGIAAEIVEASAVGYRVQAAGISLSVTPPDDGGGDPGVPTPVWRVHVGGGVWVPMFGQ